MITGRPLWVNPALNAADAFVVAWLPGSEGGGLADVLIGDAAGKPRVDFRGTLPTAWPKTADMKDGAHNPFGYGLNYRSTPGVWTKLSEDSGVKLAGDSRLWFSGGVLTLCWSLEIAAPSVPGCQARLTPVPVAALSG